MPVFLKVQTELPYVEIGDVIYTLGRKEAVIADLLVSNLGQTVAHERLMAAANTTWGSVQVMVHRLRKIFEQHHYVLKSDFELGYVLRYNVADNRRAA